MAGGERHLVEVRRVPGTQQDPPGARQGGAGAETSGGAESQVEVEMQRVR